MNDSVLVKLTMRRINGNTHTPMNVLRSETVIVHYDSLKG